VQTTAVFLNPVNIFNCDVIDLKFWTRYEPGINDTPALISAAERVPLTIIR